MGRMFWTGDTHIPIDVLKLNTTRFPIQQELTKEDHVGISGDFGLVWNYKETGRSVPSCPEDTCWTQEELYWYKWLNNKNYTTLWVDGNHENFDRLKKYPIETWNGGKVQKISDSIIHLMRGEVYEIDGIKVFAFGGGRSIDRGEARGTQNFDEGKIWWKEELPSMQEMDNARENLAKHDYKVDVVVTHALPNHALALMGYYEFDRLTSFLDDIASSLTFNKWFSGHYHIDKHITDQYITQYNDITEFTQW